MATVKLPRKEPTVEESLAFEEEVFRRKRSQLWRRYAGQFEVLYRGRVVDHGPDDELLARQAFERFGDVPFYVAKVEQQPTVYELPSPEVGR